MGFKLQGSIPIGFLEPARRLVGLSAFTCIPRRVSGSGALNLALKHADGNPLASPHLRSELAWASHAARSCHLHLTFGGTSGVIEFDPGLPDPRRFPETPNPKPYMGGCQNYGPFWGPYYNTAPIF